MTKSMILAENPRVRYLTGATMYFAQGVPYGLMHIALPAWLAASGVGTGQIASFMAILILPWALKLLSGPLMDRYQFPAMGRRRPWVLGAQLGLSLAFLSLLLVENPAEQMGLLTMLGVLINTFAAVQDVAVDGMSIDLTPVAEQGRLNAFMTFGKSIGWSVTAAISGVLLVTFGLGATALVAAIVMAVICVGFVFVLERDGERILPWSKGESASEATVGDSFRAVFRDINRVLWSRVSIVLMLVTLFDGLVSGYGKTLMPIAAIKLFGFTTPQWSQLVALMGLIGAGVALAFGPMIDRFGAKRMLFLTTLLVAVHAFLLAELQYLWENTLFVKMMLSTWVMLTPITMVCMIALAMTICSSVNSATQFAIYMSLANLGSSIGSKVYGLVAERASYVGSYLLLAALTVVMLVVLYFYRSQQQDAADSKSRRPARFPLGLSHAGGVFFSGAMRCPKCHADMEQINYEGTLVDRCQSCHGLWFDPGEVEQLLRSEAATAIDIGDAGKGREQNRIDDYPCPRCGGPMNRLVDPKQRHIWFEKCGSCRGSFFDAGEFRDLASFTMSDLFKSLIARERS